MLKFFKNNKKKIILAFTITSYFFYWRKFVLSNNKYYQIYGVTNELEIKALCLYVASALNLGAPVYRLYQFLLEIARVESNSGRALYKKDRGYGYGLWQFDRIGYQSVIQALKKRPDLVSIVKLRFFFDPLNVAYGDLQDHPLEACVFARLYLYVNIPASIPDTAEERAQQWKTYYNSIYGKGTPEAYLSRISSMSYGLV